MAATQSSMQSLESSAPVFELPDVAGLDKIVSLDQAVGKPILIAFICNHCPYVIHLIEGFVRLANRFQAQGFSVVAISSNDVLNYPQDSPEKMHGFAQAYGFEFPYCYDESQDVARAYGAECTPDFFVYDAQHKLKYRGQMDDSRPSNGLPVTGDHLSAAMSAVLAGDPVDDAQKPSIGCNIKWKSAS